MVVGGIINSIENDLFWLDGEEVVGMWGGRFGKINTRQLVEGSTDT